MFCCGIYILKKIEFHHLFQTLGFTLVQHAITKADFQPTLDGGVLIMVTGQLKVNVVNVQANN